MIEDMEPDAKRASGRDIVARETTKSVSSECCIRRDLLKVLAGLSATCGFPLLASLPARAEDKPEQTENSLGEAYLEKGLNALARAHHMSSMAGHLGASMIAAFFVGQQRPSLDPQVAQGIQGDLERVVQGESVFGKKMSKRSKLSDRDLFEPFAKQRPNTALIDGIAERLAEGIDEPRQSGHNVIFGSLALRALRQRPDLATPAIVDGIVKLMNLFVNATPGSGYYGKARGRVSGHQIVLPEGDPTPEYDSVEGMAIAVLDEVIGLTPEVNRVGYGGLVHIVNHAAAITDLADSNYSDLVPRAVRSHRQHLRLWRGLPNVADEQGPLKVSSATPHSAAYWNSGDVPYDRALLTHRVKTMFGFEELATALDDPAREQAAYDHLRFLM